jgi:8-oxo-dGTP diphosphatase
LVNTTSHIQVIARAIIIHDGHLLVTYPAPSKNYTYLPGGHVEFGEQAGTALLRELKEECGLIDASIIEYAGTIEAAFTRPNGIMQHEISVLFLVEAPSLSSKVTPQSLEEHIGFAWVNGNTLDTAKLLPSATVNFLHELGKAKKPLFLSAFEL